MTDGSQAPGQPPQAAPVCPRHSDRVSHVRCQRCGRPTCYECQRQAPVGVQCLDCVAQGKRETRTATTRYGAVVRQDTRPLVTYTLIALCALVFVGQLADPRVTRELMFVPLLGAEEPWRFLTSAFAHSPTLYVHILFNMFALWLTGQQLEPLLGRARFLALFLISALGGSVGYLVIVTRDLEGWYTSAVGASGAVFGLFAALFVLARHLGRDTAGIAVVLGINVVLGFTVPNIAWQAHLGGALTGAAVAGLIAATSPRPRAGDSRAQTLRRWQWPGMAAIVLILIAISWWALLPVM